MTEFLTIEQMAEGLLAADHILILCHKNPDGDTVGCGAALCHALRSLEKTAAVLCSDPIPEKFSYMEIPLYDGSFEPENVVGVDVASIQLFGTNNNVPELTRHVNFCIDHHAGNGGYADFTLLDATAAATAELMVDVITNMGATLTPLIADCLYTALATDTGCFKFNSTTARTHMVAARLMEAGARMGDLNKLLFETKAKERIAAERMALNNLEYHLDGQCALIYLTREEISESGVDPADLEDLTSLPLSIAGIQVGLTLRQTPVGSYRISIRTAGNVDACAIARRLGGGGHSRAAGCELEGNLDNTKNAILAEVESVMQQTQEEDNACRES